MQNKNAALRKLKSIVCFALILVYIIGLILMFTGNFGLGLIFWLISTLAGIAVLYFLHTQEKKQADLLREAEEERARDTQEQ